MKKIISMLLVFSLCLALSACGDSGPNGSEPVRNDDSVSSSEPDKAEPDDTPPQSDVASQKHEEIDFDEVVVIDNGECSIHITSIEPDGSHGYTLKAALENKSTEKTYMFAVEGAAVDGLQCDPFFASEVAAGKKSIDSISFSDSNLEKNGISFTDIELTFRVYDSNDWSADNVAEETIHIYPFGQENAQLFERSLQSSDNVIIDNDSITVTVIGYEEDDIWGYTVNMYLQNKTEKEIMFSADEVSINGYMSDPFWASSVLPGKSAFSAMSWSNSTLEESEIKSVEEIEFLFRAYDANNWGADDFVNEIITLNP